MNGRPRQPFLLGQICLAFFLVSAIASAQAGTVCVPKDMGLGAALNQAQTQTTTIQLVQGSYNLASTVWHAGVASGTYVHKGTQLLGGYTSGCASRNIAADNTVLFDSVSTPTAGDGAIVRGDLTIEGISFESQNGFAFNAIAGTSGGVPVPAGTTVLLRRDAALSGGSVSVYWGQAGSVGGTIRVVDSLMAGNLGGLCILAAVIFEGHPAVQIVNNTSVGSGTCFYNHYEGSAGNSTFQLYNNIFYGTAAPNYDLYTDDTSVVLVDNVIGNGIGPPPTKNSGTQTGDPQLDASYHPIESPASPVINTGNNNPPGGLPSSDLDGGPRIVGAIVDRGAYESSIDSGPVQTVTNNNDSGTGSLRAAVDSVNFNGGGTIKFDIGSGCGPHVITLESELDLTVDATVNGFSQTGAAANDLAVGDDAAICVILEADPAAGSPPNRGLVVPSSAGDGVSVTIKGLGFSNFSTTAVDWQGGSGHTISGSHFGGNIGGHTMLANGYDIRLGAGTHDNSIGGDDAQRNIVGDATNSGIVIDSGSTSNQVLDDYIGVGWNSNTNTYTNRGNGARGIYVAGDSTTIAYNLIAYNAQAGIVMDSGGAHDNLIALNFIGSDDTGTALGNSGAGIHLIGSAGDAPENNPVLFNTVAQNGAQGILVDVGQGNLIEGNSIYGNAMLGIDLGAVGPAFPQDDDATAATDSANRGQNFPILTGAGGDIALGDVAGSLTTTPGDYTIDFYVSSTCDPSGYGQGTTWLGDGSVTVPTPTTGDQSTASFNLQVSASAASVQLLSGVQITTTATDSLGNTSEFSPCATYVNDGIFADGFEPTSG